MPKLTLLVGRATMKVYDFAGTVIRVGRDEEMDVVIDNPSVSRHHAELRREGNGWVVADLGSSNGTFLHGKKITGAQPIVEGDEIGFGKFSLVFDKVVGQVPLAAGRAKVQDVTPPTEGTMHIKAADVKELLEDSERKRRAHVLWESGGRRGQHYLSETPAALFGTDDLCDVKVPRGPKHHLLMVNREGGCEVRNLALFARMTVNGNATKLKTLKDGEVVEMSGLKLTFVADLS
jgi:FHA domain